MRQLYQLILKNAWYNECEYNTDIKPQTTSTYSCRKLHRYDGNEGRNKEKRLKE